MKLNTLKSKLVDVFAEGKLAGNGLTIFWNCSDLSTDDMQRLTQEMRQFESIFVLGELQGNQVRARIFTMEEELDFAGHPLIGLAAHLHEEFGHESEHRWIIELNARRVHMISYQRDDYYSAAMNQGKPEFIHILNDSEQARVLKALNLSISNLANLACEVISTGLPYLIVPLTNGIGDAKIITGDFESLLNEFGAKFVYVFDVSTREGRTWDNAGKVEDIATGSAAGPAAAFLFKAGLVPANEPFQISQGRRVGRPSKITALVKADEAEIEDIVISGDVHMVASICFC